MTLLYDRPLSVSGSSLAAGSRLLVHPLAPLLQHDVPAARRALAGGRRSGDAIEPEVPVIAAQFTPCADHPVLLEKADDERPDDPLGLLAAVVAVGDPQLDLLADGVAQQGRVDLRHVASARRDEQASRIHFSSEIVRQHRADLAE